VRILLTKHHTLRQVLFTVLFRCAITTGIFYYLFLKIPVTSVIAAFTGVNLLHIAFVFFLQIAMLCVNATQLKILTERQKMGFSLFKLIKINFISRFYGLLLPGELSAGLVKWYKLSKLGGMRAEAVACIIFSRVVNTLCLAVLGITFFLIEMPYNSIPIAISLIAGLILSVILYLCIVSARISQGVRNLINKPSSRKIPGIFQEKTAKVWNSIESFQGIPPSSLRRILFLSILFHLGGIFSVYLIMRALNVDISVVSIVWIRAAVVFLQMLPISISGLGVREGAFVFLLGGYGVGGADAMAVSFLIFGITIIFGFLGGVFESAELFSANKRE